MTDEQIVRAVMRARHDGYEMEGGWNAERSAWFAEIIADARAVIAAAKKQWKPEKLQVECAALMLNWMPPEERDALHRRIGELEADRARRAEPVDAERKEGEDDA
tara:strand:- start:4013 stop:4327 length:315 start_codon:yes stop_codon:yes gene_type:complete